MHDCKLKEQDSGEIQDHKGVQGFKHVSRFTCFWACWNEHVSREISLKFLQSFARRNFFWLPVSDFVCIFFFSKLINDAFLKHKDPGEKASVSKIIRRNSSKKKLLQSVKVPFAIPFFVGVRKKVTDCTGIFSLCMVPLLAGCRFSSFISGGVLRWKNCGRQSTSPHCSCKSQYAFEAQSAKYGGNRSENAAIPHKGFLLSSLRASWQFNAKGSHHLFYVQVYAACSYFQKGVQQFWVYDRMELTKWPVNIFVVLFMQNVLKKS